MSDVYSVKTKEMSENHALAVILKSGSATNHVVNMVCEKLEESDQLTSKVAELELSLDDRDCYIADADMKNEELLNQVKVLKDALEAIKEHQEILAGDSLVVLKKLTCYQIANKALSE